METSEGVPQESIDETVGDFIDATVEKLEGADAKEIAEALSKRVGLVEAVLADVNDRLVSGKQIPADVEKRLGAFLQILEKNDEKAGEVLGGAQFLESGGYSDGFSLHQRRSFEGSEDKKPKNREEYVSSAYAAYGKLAQKYGFSPPERPEKESDEMSFDF